MSNEGGKRHFVIMLILLMVVTGTIGVYFWKSALENRVEDLREAIAFVQSSHHFASITIEEITDSTIRFKLSMFNLSEEETGSAEYTLDGSDIFLETRVAVMNWEEETRAFVFPFRVYSDTIPPAEGTIITNVFAAKDIPYYYMTEDMKVSMKLAMKNIYQVVFGEEIYDPLIEEQYFKRIFDTAVHQSVLQPFKEGKTYHYMIHPNGGIEIVEVSYGSE